MRCRTCSFKSDTTATLSLTIPVFGENNVSVYSDFFCWIWMIVKGNGNELFRAWIGPPPHTAPHSSPNPCCIRITEFAVSFTSVVVPPIEFSWWWWSRWWLILLLAATLRGSRPGCNPRAAKPLKYKFLSVTQPPGVAQPLYSRGHN